MYRLVEFGVVVFVFVYTRASAILIVFSTCYVYGICFVMGMVGFFLYFFCDVVW